jgi:SAM-dependent methyltransferase
MEDKPKTADVSESKTWETFYEDGKTGWERNEVHPALSAWIDDGTLEPPCNIAVPGCGRGSEPLELAKRGFQVTAIDFAQTAVSFQSEQLKPFSSTSSATSANVFTFAPTKPFDVVYEQTCLCAIHPARRGEYEQSIFRWLKPGGLLLALFMQTDRGDEGPPIVGPPFHCDLKDMKSLFPASRWQWKIVAPIDHALLTRYDHPSGKVYELSSVLQRKDTKHVG